MNPIKQLGFLVYEYNIELCLKITHNVKNKPAKLALMLLASPYMLVSFAVKLLWEKTVGGIIVRREILQNNANNFEHEFAVVAIAKNEALHIREWAAYHLAVGADVIYLYDNESDDNTKEQIADFIESGKVVYTYFPGKCQQLPAYEHAIKNYKDKCRYIAFIDCDEFMGSTEGEKLGDLTNKLLSCDKNAAGLGVNWAMYGSSGYETIQPGLLIENYLKRGTETDWQNFHIKTIVNPRLVKRYVSPHFPVYKLGAYSIDSKGNRQRLWFNHDVDYSKIRCCHYYCKSKQEFMLKQQRGMADRIDEYDFSIFNQSDLNSVYDETMLQYAGEVKKLHNKVQNT